MAKKVLIIDDSEQDAQIAFEAFSEAGLHAIYVNSALDAFQKVYEQVPDLIVLDILMPDLGGYELCRMFKADDVISPIPVVIYTNLEKNIDKFWAYRSGASGFVNKTEGLEKLLETSLKLMQTCVLTPEAKSLIFGSKSPTKSTSANVVSDKKLLLEGLRNIDGVSMDDEELAVKIFRTISCVFSYDLAAVCFNPVKQDKKTLLFDTTDINVDGNVFEEIKNLVSQNDCKNVAYSVVCKRGKTRQISSKDDFIVRYEFETVIDSKPAGWFFLYAKNRINPSELKLVNTIRAQVEHIIRTRYLKNFKKPLADNTDVKKLYTQIDFDRLICHEADWHRRKGLPLGLALIEIDSLESIKKQVGEGYCDVLVAKLSNILTQCLCEGEFIYRSEDNIFSILMTNSDYGRMSDSLEYIKLTVEDPLFNNFEEYETIKINIGAIVYNEDCKNHYEFIDAAYDALEESRHIKVGVILK